MSIRSRFPLPRKERRGEERGEARMDAGKIEELRAFVNVCNSNPSIFDDPSLAFFKDFVHSFGGRVPRKPGMAAGMSHGSDGGAEDSDVDDELVESDIELDSPEVEPDNDLSQKMGDISIEISEEQQEAAQVSKAKAMEAISEGKLEEATDHLTDAILRNPHSAILYANRASIFVKLKKPNAAVRDANAALQINPDSAKGYKVRGMAKALLGQWEDAAKDLHLASKLDFDEEIEAVLKKVEPNARKIEDHKRKYERLRKEKEQKSASRDRQHAAPKTQSSKSQQSEATASLQEGNVASIHSASELEAKIKAASSLSRMVILYFTAVWCGPCRFMSPLYTSLAAKYPKVVFLKVDIDESRDVAANWNISSVPTFFFLQNGKEVDRVVGADKDGLERKILQHAQ